ncbi:MAG: hypothetical protein UR39_C0017G0003 [Candidatus Woesebacteria bacterium GW2011_GWA1_33_30]|uniref:Uncharacterized protein n=1 Tax=Candidatus Woesebacteria bacterium GW2011_GWA2_33_28 TaxID=1618561 RepID=A0A0G0A457_9BACT|nr:MAG: hypothetical protein UR38_C0015G0003 [Candidatus Woesebacteria bacterium GW2011_GWA2_33_28]KKP46337.1 MAG: hypothetical protein UR39_C0017G0003 [Candidatus Woesebacteria bacterium GW2011_GWA1_33_30]KKP47832.1 MAG: hypothetical protein UR40_C0017G0003 [Microgenomates group bacterium GW2011_GWC1_33_32]KKP51270.1 MAG: hypothetical protein UR44_C0014G0003 [Candidatus Woesebacteria bacterium GW2011_GWB1_33_38]
MGKSQIVFRLYRRNYEKSSWSVKIETIYMKKIIFGLVLVLSLFAIRYTLSPTPAFAQLEDCGIDTAIGCIPVADTNQFMGWILGWAVGVGGGIAFLLIVYASFMIMTSQGDPTRLKAGQELLTSAISGLIMLIFSVFILKFIGIDILGLDQWGFGKL